MLLETQIFQTWNLAGRYSKCNLYIMIDRGNAFFVLQACVIDDNVFDVK